MQRIMKQIIFLNHYKKEGPGRAYMLRLILHIYYSV